MLSLIAKRDDEVEKKRRALIFEDTYSAPSTTLYQHTQNRLLTHSDEENQQQPPGGGGYSENDATDQIVITRKLTEIIQSEKRKIVIRRRIRKKVLARAAAAAAAAQTTNETLALKKSRVLPVLHLSAVKTTHDESIPLRELDGSNSMRDALSSESTEEEPESPKIKNIAPPKRPILDVTVLQEFEKFARAKNNERVDQDVAFNTLCHGPYIVSFDAARAYLTAVQAEQIEIDFYGCTQAMLVCNEYVFTSHTAILGDDNVVFGPSNMFIGNRNIGNGAFLRARGANNILNGRYGTNYDSGEKGIARGMHSVRIKIRMPAKTADEFGETPKRLSQSAIAAKSPNMVDKDLITPRKSEK